MYNNKVLSKVFNKLKINSKNGKVKYLIHFVSVSMLLSILVFTVIKLQVSLKKNQYNKLKDKISLMLMVIKIYKYNFKYF